MGAHQKKLRKLAPDPCRNGDPSASPAANARPVALYEVKSARSKENPDTMAGQNVRNLSILSISILVTSVLSMVMRMYIPRVLGVEALGQFQFAEQLGMFLFGFMPFGISSYINKNVPPNPDHAREITFTIAAFQTAIAAAIFALLFGVLAYLDRGQDVVIASLLMAGWAYSETLQTTTFKKMYIVLNKMKRIGTLNVILKAIQVVAVICSLLLSGSMIDLAWAYLGASALGFAILSADLLRLKVLTINFDASLLKNIVRQSLPYFFGLILISAFQSTDTIILSLVGNDTETGYFGAAYRLIGVLMIVVPALDSAFIPSQSRNFVHNKPLFAETLENIITFLLVVSLGCSLVLGLFSELIVSTIFGAGFEKSYKIVSYLAPVLSLTYINTVLGSSLNIASSGKQLSIIMAIALSSNVIGNYLLIPYGIAYWGEGGGGITVACTTIVAELMVALGVLLTFPVPLNYRRIFYRVAMVALPCIAMLVYYEDIGSLSILERLAILVGFGPFYLFATRIVSRRDVVTALDAARSAVKKRMGA